ETWQGDDAQRPLTDDGIARTVAATAGLAAIGERPDTIVSSPYARAKTTAELVASAFGQSITLDSALEPGATLSGVAASLAALSDAAAVLLVGHEPDLSTLIGELIAGSKGAAGELKKGCSARGDLPTRATRHAATAPEKLAGSGTLIWLMTAAQLGMLSADGRASLPADTGQADADESPSLDAGQFGWS